MQVGILWLHIEFPSHLTNGWLKTAYELTAKFMNEFIFCNKDKRHVCLMEKTSLGEKENI